MNGIVRSVGPVYPVTLGNKNADGFLKSSYLKAVRMVRSATRRKRVQEFISYDQKARLHKEYLADTTTGIYLDFTV